ncbi:MAG: PAN domain-containing protein, partial [Rhizobiaceae bacterium]
RHAYADGPYLTRTETVLDDPKYFAGQWTITDGAMKLGLNDDHYRVQFNWSQPPAVIDSAGFDITLNVAGQVKSNCEPMYSGINISGNFAFSPDPGSAEVNLTPPAPCDVNSGASGQGSVSVNVKPQSGIVDGQTVDLRVGAAYGPGVVYRYLVSATKPPVAPPAEDDQLAATLECDSGSITISALPSLNCHILFTSWRRNTADPVEVSFPNELDSFGNHPNGIQLSGRGSEDVFNWDKPHSWGLFVFACPGQQGAGVNCYSSVTSPGPTETEILVRQGEATLRFILRLNAIGSPPVAGSCGFNLGSGILAKWLQTGGEAGFLGCPTGDEAEAGRSPAGTGGRYALFKGGVIVWHGTGQRAGAAYEVHGCIGSLYQGMNGTNSFLGFPVSDEYDTGGGRRSDFEGGYIVWNAATGVCNAHRNGNVTFTYERNTDRPGLDYRHFELAQDNAALCRDACAAEDQCTAYTYVRAGAQGASAMCWLKSAVPPELPSDCCVSGRRR